MNESSFFFRGQRKYIQAADLIDFTIAESIITKPVSNIDFSIYKKCTSEPIIVQYAKNLQATAYARYIDQNSDVLLLPGTQEPTDRLADDEELMQQTFLFMERSVHIPTPTKERSFCRSAAVAFKALLHNLNCAQPNSKFLLARITSTSIHSGPYSISFSRLIGNRFYEGIITTPTEKLGAIYFALEQ